MNVRLQIVLTGGGNRTFENPGLEVCNLRCGRTPNALKSMVVDVFSSENYNRVEGKPDGRETSNEF